MTLYYIEQTGDATFAVYKVDSSDRAKLWVAHPKVKEISKKEYWNIQDIIKAKQTEDQPINT